VFEFVDVADCRGDECARLAEFDFARIAAIKTNTISNASGAKTFSRMPSLLLADGFDFISHQQITFAPGLPAGCQNGVRNAALPLLGEMQRLTERFAFDGKDGKAVADLLFHDTQRYGR